MKAAKFRSKNIAELKEILLDSHKEYFKLRMKHRGTELKDTSKLRKIKKEIARIKTIIREKND